MQWENLTSPEFAQAVRDTKTCVLALGVVERHGDHMPLGTDFLNGHALACLAAEREPAVVFPPFYFGQIYEARCFPGTITIKPTLLLELLQAVLDEIGRNGFEKIILCNAHGGNSYLLGFLTQCQLWEPKPYAVYYYQGLSPEGREKQKAILETEFHGHACEWETSLSLANHPQLVEMDQVPPGVTEPLRRAAHLKAGFSALSWYSNFPEHYVGDASYASREKGQALRELEVESLVQFIRAVKADEVIPALQREFHGRVQSIGD